MVVETVELEVVVEIVAIKLVAIGGVTVAVLVDSVIMVNGCWNSNSGCCI